MNKIPEEDEENFDKSAIESLRKSRKKKNKRGKSKNNKGEDSDDSKNGEKVNKTIVQVGNDQFIINQRYSLIKMLGSGSFGEIHLAYDKIEKRLNAIKFELLNAKNPQLKHEFNILEQLNRVDLGETHPIGIPKVHVFDKIEGKCNYLVMEFLGPTLSDLFISMNKQFSFTTVLLIAIQMLQRIEYVHSKGFIHRDIKPENFLIGLNDNSNLIHIIDFGLSKRYKDKSNQQHIPYRENRHLVGTARYLSLNSHLGIEQSRRDDLESIGYLLVYFHNGRLPWQSKQEKTKYLKIQEKKLSTPVEVLCKKLPIEFSYYFHYCKNLRFDDKPDYNLLKGLFFDLLMQNSTPSTEFTFDWFNEDEESDIKDKDYNTPDGEDANKRENKLNKNLDLNEIKSKQIYGSSRELIEEKQNNRVLHGSSSGTDSDELTERIIEEKFENEEFVKILASAHESDSKKNSNIDSNFNLFQKSSHSSNKPNDEIILKPSKGSRSHRDSSDKEEIRDEAN